MVCESVDERDLIERYLLGRLSDADREAFEAHAFECERCLGALETMRVLREELRRERVAAVPDPTTGSRAPWDWHPVLATAAAVLVVLMGAGGVLGWLWHVRSAERPGAVSTELKTPAAPSTSGKSAPSIPSTDAVLELARIDPPRYVPFTVRGAGDDRAGRFDRAMQDYSNGNYERAAIGLRRVLADDSEDVETNFFLGIALLMTDDVDRGIERLRVTIALGESSFRELASLDLGKVLIRKGDLAAAERELNRTITLQGSHRSEASDLLRALQALRRSSR
jgi:hypothetical protein